MAIIMMHDVQKGRIAMLIHQDWLLPVHTALLSTIPHDQLLVLVLYTEYCNRVEE